MTQDEPKEVVTVGLPDAARHLGRDREGADHYFVPGESVIVVKHTQSGDEVVMRVSLKYRQLSEWVDHVILARGWSVLKYDDRPAAEWLFERRAPQEMKA